MEKSPADVDNADSKSKLDFYFFGRNLGEIPCLRSSLLGGLLSGIGMGVTYFMFTSNTRRALTIAQFAPVPVALMFWFSCRYDNANRRFEARRLQTALQEYQLIRGTDKENEILGQQSKDSSNASS